MQLMAELAKAEELALLAGRLALSLQANLTVTQKPFGNGPVSNGDLAADHLITEDLQDSFPNDLIVSEESFANDLVLPSTKRIWFIDPIDGTSSYILERPDYVVMIGLAHAGKPLLGVIYQPATDTLWSGINAGPGSFCQRSQGKSKSPILCRENGFLNLKKDLTLLASRTSRSKKQEALIQCLLPQKIVFQSSVGLKAMMVLDGQGDLYVCWSHHVKMWDSCAPAAIIAAAGAFMGNIDGSALRYEGPLSHGHALMAASCAPDTELKALLKGIDERKIVG